MDASTEASTNSSSNPANAPAGGTAPAADQSHGLAADLQRLEDAANGMPITVERLLETLSERGHAVAILILTAPFVLIPVPGLSTAVSVVVFGLAIGVILGGRAWMPGFVRRREISPERLHSLTNGTRKLLSKIGRLVKPRMSWVTHRSQHWLIGLSLFAGTFIFALPLPIPGNNIPPAIGLVMLSLGMIERDGLLVLLGHIYTLILCIILIVCAFLFWEAIDGYVHALFQRIGNKFG